MSAHVNTSFPHHSSPSTTPRVFSARPATPGWIREKLRVDELMDLALVQAVIRYPRGHEEPVEHPVLPVI